MNQPDDKQLRDDYRRLGGDSPSADIDARILAEARRAVNPRRRNVAAWTGLVALAASIGLAVVLVPTLLLETPSRETATMNDAAPATDSPEVALERVQVTGSRVSRTDVEEAAEREARRGEKVKAEALLAQPAMETMEADRARAIAGAMDEAGPDLAALRAELEGAPELQWRATLVALRDSGRRAIAEQLMPTYRQEFDLDESLTLDMLVAEVQQ